MKTKKRKSPPPPAEKPVPGFSLKFWHVAAAAFGALVAVLAVYGPALNGPFVFDDMYLPFYSRHFSETALSDAMHGVRPLLMVSYWISHHFSGLEPYGYHLLNILFHLANSLLVFFIARRLLARAGVQAAPRRELLAAFAAGLFLLHPVQTESVAYVASRSETLSVLFFYSAFALFLYRRREAVSWRVAAGILILFGAAASTKEHTVVLPALLLLTDYFWSPGYSFSGIRRNWRLYVPLAAVAAFGLISVKHVLSAAQTAGFGMRDLPWQQYLYTQWRAVWVYLRLFVLPVGLNVDYDYPISRSVLDHGALFGLIGLAALVGCALYFRRRYPLAAYGFLTSLILLAPTSSFIPIQDALAERRLYLPMIGLLLIVLEFLRRWQAPSSSLAAALAVVLAVAGLLTYQRSRLWGDEVALWEDALSKSPQNARAHFQLALSYYEVGRCDVAVQQYEAAARLKKPDNRLLVDWAMAENCRHKPEAALEKLQQALELEKSAHTYSLIGMVYAQQRKLDQALEALNKATVIDPQYDMTYVYRANVYVLLNRADDALRDYHLALQLNPDNESARKNLAKVESRLRGRR